MARVNELRAFADAGELARAAAEEVARRGAAAVHQRGRFTIALSGGATPRRLYALLADPMAPLRERLDWNAIDLFWGDERHVPPDHPDSNYRMAREALIDHVPIPPERVHRVPAEDPDAARAAALYEAELRQAFALAPPQKPRFDLMLLGLGPDGHTASLFPGSAAVHETERLVVAPWIEKFSAARITVTPPVINHAAAVIFLVSGEDKADALVAVREGERQVERYPAQVVAPDDGELLWLVDRAAARQLSGI